MTEQELRNLLRRSKEAGQRAIFDQYSNYVYTIVYSKLRTCGTYEDVEECVSDVFAKIFMSLDVEQEVPELASGEDVQKDYTRKEMSRKLLENIRQLGEPDATIIILCWMKDGYMMYMTNNCDFPLDEVIRIAESVTEVQPAD
ncbi:MAG: hypothetical protein K6F27_10530 [Ruminococcus sp.]|nr:hypothetical protein [Ruminococcus sp.]